MRGTVEGRALWMRAAAVETDAAGEPLLRSIERIERPSVPDRFVADRSRARFDLALALSTSERLTSAAVIWSGGGDGRRAAA